MKSLLCSSFLCVVLATAVQAQAQESILAEMPAQAEPQIWNLQTQDPGSWTHFHNAELGVLYLDLGSYEASGRLQSLNFQDETGESRWQDEALDLLPFDAVYEIEVKDLPAGIYNLRLRTLDGRLFEQRIEL